MSRALNHPFGWCLLAALLFGGSTPAAKQLLHSLGPLTLAGLLYLGAALGVAPFGAASFRRSLQDRRSRLYLAGAVLFGGILGPVLLMLGLAQAPAASVALWLNLETVATALLGWVLFREHLDRRVVGAIVMVLVASILLVSPDRGSLAPAAGLVALACLCWGLDNNLTSLIDGLTPTQSTLAKGLAAGLFNLLLGLWLEPWSLAVGTILFALAIGALGYGISIALYIAGAQQMGATRSQVLFATAPYFGVVVAWFAFGEAIQPVQLGAIVLMVVSLALLAAEHHAHEHDHQIQHHVHWHHHRDGHHDHDHPEGQPAVRGWHSHPHRHEPRTHRHPHRPDLHHRHDH